MRQLIHITCVLVFALVSLAACGDKQADEFGKPGFVTEVHDGRLWVFREGSEALAQFRAVGEPAKSVTLIGVGPQGMTVRSDDKAVISDYLAAK